MVNKTTAVYSIIDDILKSINHYDDKRRSMTDAEIITTAIISTCSSVGTWRKPDHSCQALVSLRIC